MARDGGLSKRGVGSRSSAAWSAREIELQALALLQHEIAALRAEFNADARKLRFELSQARDDLQRLRASSYFTSAERD